jgi:hypothetical protein
LIIIPGSEIVARKHTLPTPAQDKLNAVGIEKLCERIFGGESMPSIAASVGVSESRLSDYLARPEHIALSARARMDSAEAWLDSGLACIASSLRKDGEIDPSAARAYAHECARRAAIRNPKYRDKVALGGDADNPLVVVGRVERVIVDKVGGGD